MSRGLVGAAAGAGAATLYYKPELLRDFVRDAALGVRPGSALPPGADPVLGRELERLQQMVRGVWGTAACGWRPAAVVGAAAR